MSKSTAAKAGASAYAAGRAAQSNPFVHRLVEDDELRDSLRDAVKSARRAYDRLSSSRRPVPRALMDDKRVQRDLREAADSIRSAADSLRNAKHKRKRHPIRKLIVIGVVGAGLTLVVSEGTRKKLLDALFGAEEEFEYTSTTTPDPAPTNAQPQPAAKA